MGNQKPQRSLSRRVVFALFFVFLLPIAARAALYVIEGGPRSWRDADWSSIGSLPPAKDYPDARVLILSGRTGGWKGVVAVQFVDRDQTRAC